MIAIIDYGVGNLRSVYKALSTLSLDAKVTNDPLDIEEAKGIILPGVGAFKDAMEQLKARALIPSIKRNINKGKPILGICLGMQLLYDKSFEDGDHEGLGILSGEVVEFSNSFKVPHMGWNQLITKKDDAIIKYVNNREFVYFVHSYYVKSKGSEVIAWGDYGVRFPAIVGRENVYGMQFHPEKSGKLGLKLLKAFGELII